jgi:excisionase family DNA binding protein
MQTAEKFLTLGEVADMLRCSELSVRNWVKDSKFPAPVVPSRKWLFRADEVESFLAMRQRKCQGGDE